MKVDNKINKTGNRQNVSSRRRPQNSINSNITRKRHTINDGFVNPSAQGRRLNKELIDRNKERANNLKKQKQIEKKRQAEFRRNTIKSKRKKINLQERLGLFSISSGMDIPFLILILILVSIGLVMMFSASYANAYYIYKDSYKFIKSQLPMAVIGVIVMIFISYIDYHILRKLAVPFLILSFLLLFLVLIMPPLNNVHRWIQIGMFSFQASEVTKFALILFFSYIITKNFTQMNTLKKGVIPFILVLIPTLILLVLEPHISCIVIILMLTAIMMFIGGAKLRWFSIPLGVIVAAGTYVILFTDTFKYAGGRISSWLNPLTYVDYQQWQDTWQTRNSLYAIGSGGLLGLGLGNSRQKFLFLPEPQNDFVFAIVCEELGFIGALIVLILFGLLIWRGITVSMRARDKFGAILGIGLTAQVGLQVFLNIAVVTNIIPNTGISLPFFSAGGTSLLMLLAQMGVVLSISRTSKIEKN